MAKLYGTHICSRCKNSFTWDYHIPDKKSNRTYDVETVIPQNCHAKRINSIKSPTFELQVNCKFCHNQDIFIYIPDNSDI